MLILLVAFTGCESSSSVSATPAPAAPEDQTIETSDLVETGESANSEEIAEAVEPDEVPSSLASEAAEKYRLANQLLDFAGPIEDFSSESNNVRWLAAELLETAIKLDPTKFVYYRDLFMTYMILQEPVKALEAIEPASETPGLADEVAEFRLLVFGAMEYASMLEPEG